MRYVFGFIVSVISFVSYAQVITINEVMFSNKTSITDAFEKHSDWIELYNPGDNTVNLEAWQIIDNPEKNSYWTFPKVHIEPHSFLLVFASGNDIYDTTELHTNFKIANLKEGVFLFNPQGEQVSVMPVQCVPTDFSLGYITDGLGATSVLTPSPGISNTYSDTIEIDDYEISEIEFSHESGMYPQAFQITLESTDSLAKIYYTLNSKDPDENDEFYDSPLTILNRTLEDPLYATIKTSSVWNKPRGNVYKATILRAVAYRAGCPASKIYTKTYFVDSIIGEKYNVPIVSIVTDPDNLFDKDDGIYVVGNYENYSQRGKSWEREAHFEMFDSTQSLVLQQSIGIRIHGGASRAAPQKSLRLYAREEYGTSSFAYQFFNEKSNIQSFNTLILRSARDWSFVLFKDELCHSLVRDMNIDNMATATSVVFINGEYWGIHSFHEYQDENYIQQNYGYSSSDFDIITYQTELGVYADAGSMDAYTSFITFLETHSLEFDENYRKACSFVDVNNLIDFYIAQLYFSNSDFPKKNLKMWRESTQDTSKFRYLFFDCDGCMIRTNYNHIDNYNNDIDQLQPYPEWSQFILQSFLQNRAFRHLFTQRFYYHLQHTFRPDIVIERIEEFESLFLPLAAEHTLRWRLPENIRDWQSNVHSLKLFALQRPAVLYEELQANFESLFEIYPNPANKDDGFRVWFIEDKSVCAPISITVYSPIGIRLYAITTNSCEISSMIIQPNIEPGLYLIAFEYCGYTHIKKLCIE